MIAQLIYTRIIPGGIGYAPKLYRIGRKYYTVRGDTDADGLRTLAAMDIPECKNNMSHHLWMVHQYDMVVTASEFLKILEAEQS